MNNLTILENGLIPVYEGENGKAVNARELHEFLEVKDKFATWINRKIEQYGFLENEDYISLSQKCEGNNATTIDYILTMDTAKEIAMVQNNDKGSQARKYFIAVEKKYKQVTKTMTQAELTAAIAQNQVEIEHKINSLDTKITNALDVFTTPTKDDWRHEMNEKVNGMCITQGLNYQTFKHEIYTELEDTVRVNLSSRQSRLRARMKKGGFTATECRAISKIEVIERDIKLKSIFEGIVRKYQAKYAVI